MFTEHITVSYSDLDVTLTASPAAILRYYQNAAISHSREAGFPLKKLYAEGHAWILISVNAEFYRYPEEGEEINVSTFTPSYERVFGNRAFIITDKNGATIARASTVWVFTNTKTKHPCRVDEAVIKAYTTHEGDCLPFLRHDISTERGEAAYSITAAKRDTDTNSHVNNVRLAEFTAEALPIGIKPRTAQIFYKSSVYVGDTLTAFTRQDGDTYHVRLENDQEQLMTSAIFEVNNNENI